jgi:hypothetical protein
MLCEAKLTRYGDDVATQGWENDMGDNSSSAERVTDAVELSKEMLDLIRAYGAGAAGDVRDSDPKTFSPQPERLLASADGSLQSPNGVGTDP